MKKNLVLVICFTLCICVLNAQEAKPIATNPEGSNIPGGMQATPADPILTNNGTIEGGMSVLPNTAVGMFGTSTSSANFVFTNNGTITIDSSDTVYGMYASSNGINTVTNTGNIQITSTNNEASGLFVNTAGSTLNNTGIINVFAPTNKAFEANGSENYNVETFATTLRDWTSSNAVFGIADGKAIHFSDATLILRPGSEAQGFALFKHYSLQDMAYEHSGNNASLSGSINTVTTEVPFLVATITGDTLETTTFFLSANFNEKTSPASTTAIQTYNSAQEQFNIISRQLYRESEHTKEGWNIALSPYIDYTNNDEYSYSGNNYGVAFTGTYLLNNTLSLGGHFSARGAHYSANLMNMTTSEASSALGFHATYSILPNFYVSNQTTGIWSTIDTDYSLQIGSTSTQNTSLSWNTDFTTGYKMPVSKANTFTPELGLSYVGMRINPYDILWNDQLSVYNLENVHSTYNGLLAKLKLNWKTEWELENKSNIALTIGAAVHQNILASDIVSSQDLYDVTYTSKSAVESTKFTLDTSLNFNEANGGFSLIYNGQYSNAAITHGGSIVYRFNL